ncbi:uroporphyrinogen-III C-methyltransferase [Rhodocytophaga rosea]|uniref:uroporphyrinogen-III C-methyltransferase n=1 Tax=Rhodocytophaga rosea TaxID=2704465 RepID=A0A6C0GJG2_9BACT|nr:uroporphyrinogen-III C-methyltransferase [Rhodocytophaga rosea]QHT68077.1 uroporphyrinogen-III C-methyltransferase [Rhodocytophaga rosea]
MQKLVYPKVTLVGAGPGDASLITVKGLKALWEADVVLYDALVNKELLEHVADEVPTIFVGKRAAKHEMAQEDINKLIVDAAFAYGHVVRLKGGDSFVFGRGHEEITYIESYNIPTSVIPGISSSIAVPELQRIPLTSRGISESFWVLTGTTQKGEVSTDIKLAAQSQATAIILMGLHKLREIAAIYAQYGRNQLPVAVIQNGSLPEERFVLGTVETIVDLVNEQKIASPAVIVLGEVVREHPEFVLQRITESDIQNVCQN